MIRVFILFILALVFLFSIQLSLERLVDYVTGTTDEDEEEDDIDEPGRELLKVLFFYALRAAAIIGCAVLPALVQGGLWMALILGVIQSLVIEIVWNISNLKAVKLIGLTPSIIYAVQITITTVIVTAASYYMAWWILV